MVGILFTRSDFETIEVVSHYITNVQKMDRTKEWGLRVEAEVLSLLSWRGMKSSKNLSLSV